MIARVCSQTSYIIHVPPILIHLFFPSLHSIVFFQFVEISAPPRPCILELENALIGYSGYNKVSQTGPSKFFLIFLSDLYIQCGARAHSAEIKNGTLHQLGPPGAPRPIILNRGNLFSHSSEAGHVK